MMQTEIHIIKILNNDYCPHKNISLILHTEFENKSIIH